MTARPRGPLPPPSAEDSPRGLPPPLKLPQEQRARGGPSCTRAGPAHQVQGRIDLEGLLQGAPSDLQEGDPAGGVPSVADLVAVMRDGLAEGRHDERRR